MGLMDRIQKYTEDRAYRKEARARAEAHAKYVGRHVRHQKIREKERKKAQKKYGAYVPVPGAEKPGKPGWKSPEKAAARAKARKKAVIGAAKLIAAAAENAGRADREMAFGQLGPGPSRGGRKPSEKREPKRSRSRSSDVDRLFYEVDTSDWLPGFKR